MISRNRAGLDIDEQAMNEAILNPHASQRRRSYREGRGADCEYANVVEELRQLRAASQLSRYRGAAPRAFCIWLYPYPAFLRYAAHSAGG